MSGGTDINLDYDIREDLFKWVSFEVRREGQVWDKHAFIRDRTFHTKVANKNALS